MQREAQLLLEGQLNGLLAQLEASVHDRCGDTDSGKHCQRASKRLELLGCARRSCGIMRPCGVCSIKPRLDAIAVLQSPLVSMRLDAPAK